MYVYIFKDGLYQVGFYHPTTGRFECESDHGNSDDAAQRVSYLNGGSK